MARTQLDGYQIENDSVTGADVSEESLVDSKIPFADIGFLSIDIHEAIIEALKSKYAVDRILTGYEKVVVLTDENGNVLTRE